MSNETSAVQKAKELEKDGIAIVVGSPSIFELFVGLTLSKKPIEEKKKITLVLASCAQLPLENDSVSAAGTIYGEKMRSGSYRPGGCNDSRNS